MLVKRDLGFTSPVFLVVVVVVPVIVLILRRKWQQSVARSEEVKRLLISASVESTRVEFEVRGAYYYTATATPSVRVSVSTPTAAPTYASVPLGSPLKPQYQCAVCFCPTSTRCAKCKAVRYCSGKCQIVHWRQGHKDECRPYVAVSPINNVGGLGDNLVSPARKSTGLGDNLVSPARKSTGLGDNSVGPARKSTGLGDNSISPARKSAGLRDNNQKTSNLNDEDTQSGTSGSSFWTDGASNKSSLSEPTTNSFGFWDGNIRHKKSSIKEHDDLAPGSVGEATNDYMANSTTKCASGLTGLESEKSTSLSNDMVNNGSKSNRPPTCTSGMFNHKDGDADSDLPTPKFRESKNSPAAIADKAVGGLPSVAEKSNDVFSEKGTTPHMSKSHSTKLVKDVDDDSHRVTTCSSQLTETSRSVRSRLKTSKLKVVDHLKPSKLSHQESLEIESEIFHRYTFKGLFPYEMFVKLYNWKQVELQPCGLKNCGNSCYANAVLQCLIYTPPLTAYLLEGLHSKACDKRGRCFTCEFEGLVMKAKDGNSPLSPIRMLTHIENVGSNLGHGKEEDAHEFLRYVIDALQSVCIKEAGTNSLNSLEEETTLVGLTFGGYLRSKIICIKCGGKSEQHERMMDLTVEIEGDIRTLEEALDKFTCTEILDGENKYKCSRCKSYERAKKKLTLLEAPNVLTIALKRFQSGKYGKLNKSIHFPEILDMAPYVSGTSDKSPIYRLYGVVVHVDTMNAAFSGHYVCYVKNLQNRWFKFDDSMVKEVDLQHVLTKGAYMLLYARCSPRAPRSIRSSLIHHHDPRKPKIIPPFNVSRSHSTEPWDACTYHPPQVHRSLEEESTSSSDNSGFFSESCSCSTESTHRDSSSIEDHISGDWEPDYQRNINLNSSDSDTSSTSSFPSPLYSRLSHLYASTTNGEDDHKVCRNLDCSCNSCRVTNLDRLGGPASYPTSKPGVTFRRSMTRGKSE